MTDSELAQWRNQPIAEVERDGVHYTLLGTAHVSHQSTQAVREAVSSAEFDCIAIELDPQRHDALFNPDAMAKLDLAKVMRENKVAMFAANLALAAYQRRLAEQLGIEPGAELKAASTEADALNLPVKLIDREIGITFKRAMQGLKFWDRMKIGGGMITSLFADEEVSESHIENLKEGDMLEASFGDFAKESPALFSALIDERDQYMAAKLRQIDGARRVLAVVGAGHLKGIAKYLKEETTAPADILPKLDNVVQKRKIPWVTLIISALVIGGIVWGFTHGGISKGMDLIILWSAWTAGLAALGAAIAAAHPFSIIVAAIVAPFKPFRPGMPAGMFSGLTELKLRNPTYADFLSLRNDAQTLKGWYSNRVCRVVLVFMMTNFGMMAGEWIAIARGAKHLFG
ncbi:TraB/GumN family protein [Lysobacter sp. HDW10]|uniref:TraB/GumN family protein n=1 Tax=Lysobacter sp. HDW10 TaxID=2714936 RepID=UPI001409020A|nr:TraB/GumN family protein [Lysobacter sp. HDW10]QIK81467.1 TraB/GumN family protein [Lysobacter sp. HDW10]